MEDLRKVIEMIEEAQRIYDDAIFGARINVKSVLGYYEARNAAFEQLSKAWVDIRTEVAKDVGE